MAFVGLLLLCCSLCRIPFSFRHMERVTMEDGNCTVSGQITDLTDREKTLRLTVATKRNKKVLLYIPYESVQEEIGIGDMITGQGDFSAYRSPGNPGQFDTKTYYQIRGITGSMYCTEYSLQSKGTSFRRMLRSLRNGMHEIFYQIFPEEQAGFVCGILLGEKEAVDEEMKSLYRQNGIAHILAISGLHISLIGQILYQLFSTLFQRRIPAAILSFILLSGYVIMVGAGPSVLRSYLFFLLGVTANAIRKGYDRYTAWALSFGLLATFNPLILLDQGCIFSFVASGSLLLSGHYFKRTEREKKIMQESVGLGGRLKKIFIPSLVLQIMLFPVSLYYFMQYPVYSVFINWLVIPGVPVLLLSAIGALGIELFANRGKWLAFPVKEITFSYEKLCRFFEGLPFTQITPGKPKGGIVLCSYVLLLLTWIIWKHIKRMKRWVQSIVIITMLIFSVGILCVHSNRDLSIIVQDIGQGESIFLSTPDHLNLLIDGGSSDLDDPAKYRLLPFLQAQGVSRLDFVFLTHGDADHCNAIEELLASDEIKIDHLIISLQMAQTEEGKRMAALSQEKAVKLLLIAEGESLKIGRLSMTCLYPDENVAVEDPNQASVVLHLSYGDFSMLLTGDLDGEGEQTLCEILEERQLQATVLKVPHHGSANGTSERLINEVTPAVAVISCGYENRYGHPHKEVLERLEENKVAIYRTDLDGAITIRTNGSNYRISTFRK